ncbi:MAG: NHL repeat-containing protein, partial [Planctomycetota bacterium]
MRTGIACILMFLLLTFLHNTGAYAVSTRFFKHSAFEGFSEGVKGCASLTSDGLKLSPYIDPISGINEPYVWCLTEDEYANIYIGTGDPGSVYKLSPTGGFFLLHTFSELYVHSLAVSETGNIYAGTSPQGIIYKITPWRDVIALRDLPDSYIWDLQFDNTGVLYVATGPEGKIYRMSEKGELELFFDSAQTHILDIVIDKDNNVYACSEPDGLIYKITPQAKAFVVYDAREGEVHSLALHSDGNLYAGTASGARPQVPVLPQQPPPLPKPEPQPPTVTLTPLESGAPRQAIPLMPQVPGEPQTRPDYRPPPFARLPQPGNVVYKITPDGIVKKVLDVENGFVFALCPDDRGAVYVGTGNRPALYRIDAEENASTLLEPEEAQIISLLFLKKKALFMGTGNDGNLYKLSQTYANSGSFLSPVCDAGMNSSWGNVSWDAKVPAGTELSFATRTGNSETPDDTWSNWSSVLGSGKKGENPPSRFIQYQATFSTTLPNATPLLTGVSIAYLPKNQPPEITSLAVDGKRARMAAGRPAYGRRLRPPDDRNMRMPPPGNGPGRLSTMGDLPDSGSKLIEWDASDPNMGDLPDSGSKLIEWDASDPNDDNLVFDLHYKGVMEREWKVLQEGSRQRSYRWQTTRVPDGEYAVKLVAADLPDNPPEIAIDTEKVSQTFIIDNTRPRLTDLNVTSAGEEKVSVAGAFSDELSGISSFQYSVDAGDWVSIFPEDSIFDSKEEAFTFTVDELVPGEHTLVINAADQEGNIGTGKAVVE